MTDTPRLSGSSVPAFAPANSKVLRFAAESLLRFLSIRQLPTTYPLAPRPQLVPTTLRLPQVPVQLLGGYKTPPQRSAGRFLRDLGSVVAERFGPRQLPWSATTRSL